MLGRIFLHQEKYESDFIHVMKQGFLWPLDKINI